MQIDLVIVALGDQKVLRFQIPVKDPTSVDEMDGDGHICEEAHNFPLCEGLLVSPQVLCKVSLLVVIVDDIAQILVIQVMVEGFDNERVAQGAREGFLQIIFLEPLLLYFLGDWIRKDFYCTLLAVNESSGFENCAATTLTEFLSELVC